jgi:D-alanine--poly(phosphoribitol) ligase subunit 1
MDLLQKLNCIERFEQAARTFEHDPCIEEGDRTLTYGAFFGLVKNVAAAVRPASRVLLDLPQGIDAYAAIIGVLSAGACYCPMPQQIPAARRASIISAFEPDQIISGPVNAGSNSAVPAAKDLPADALAYVLFTSGSTGIPKGVMVGRNTIDIFLGWSLAVYEATPNDRWGQFCKLNFDLSVIDLFTSLCSGACLVVLNDLQSELRPQTTICERRLSVWHSVPSLVDFMIANERVRPMDLSVLRVASFCGEPLKKYQLDFLFGKNKALRVINSYGTTEGGLNATWLELNAENYTSLTGHYVSVGRAIPGWKIELSPDGEIIICGDNIGKGYLNASGEKFGTIALEGKSCRAFFTGDQAYAKDGLLYFTGRKDQQIKLRGNRIELSEIEFRIAEICGKACVTILHHDALYAFIETNEKPDTAVLRQKLMQQLEKIKIPERIIAVATFPRNPNFKIDRQALAALLPPA